MTTIVSNTESRESLDAVLKSRGITPDVSEPVIETAKAPETPTPPPAIPGESPSGQTGESAPVLETGKESTQVTQAVPPVPPAEPKPEAKFEPRRKQLERQVARLHEDLELERGSKTTLQTKLAEAEAKLAELTPAIPKDDTPVKPKRPTRAEHEFDDEKYEVAMDKHEQDMAAYHAAVTDKTVNDRLAKRDQEDKDKAAKASADAYYADYEKRRDEEAGEIPDYRERLEASPDFKVPDAVEMKILQSEIPAHLIHFFLLDAQEGEGKELARISRLDPVFQGREVARIETRLAVERELAKKAAAAPVVAEVQVTPPKPPETPPAKPIKKAPLEPPIEPLGSRTNGHTPTLAEAKTPKEFFALRAQGINR